ncbi:MAG: tRNA pseudouridine(38-40) synthase TruA [Chitinophagaceae bacterium]|nr:tRNA pseudouridine(38-40) synthase TruA [Chitinophagaceae bacterium]
MSRFFIEVAYQGTHYSGFQIQQNANSIQQEVEKALKIFFRKKIVLTGASRTDAGVHALQNYFHFDFENLYTELETSKVLSTAEHGSAGTDGDLSEVAIASVYNLNAILPPDIVIKKISPVKETAHCRFDAIEREYKYFIYQKKDPFLRDRGFYYPYKFDLEKLQEAAGIVLMNKDFSAFSKRNTQVKNFICSIFKSEWKIENEILIYHVVANRFLRGMVRGLVGTMLRVGTSKISLQQFAKIIEKKDAASADFSVPAHALFLTRINYPAEIIT